MPARLSHSGWVQILIDKGNEIEGFLPISLGMPNHPHLLIFVNEMESIYAACQRKATSGA